MARKKRRGRGQRRWPIHADPPHDGSGPPVHGQHPDSVSASDLARFGGICQMQSYLDTRYKKGAALVGVGAERERGLLEHERHHLVQPAGTPVYTRAIGSPVVSRRDRRCFVASAVYGPDAWQTVRLRDWRDTRLLPSWWGRLLVRLYYRIGPCLVALLPAGSRRAMVARWVQDAMLSSL